MEKIKNTPKTSGEDAKTHSKRVWKILKPKKVLLISTDPAHSLGDAFKMPFGAEPTPVGSAVPNLSVMEINPEQFLKDEIGIFFFEFPTRFECVFRLLHSFRVYFVRYECGFQENGLL